MITDEQLLDEVRAVLHDEVADVTASQGLLPALHRGLRRRRTTRRWLAVAATASVAAAVAVVVTAPQTPREPATAERSARPQPPVALAHAEERTVSALDAVRDHVIHETSVVTNGEKYGEPGEEARYERWLAADGSSFRLLVTVDGQPVVDLSRDRVSDVFVDYRTRTYRVFPGIEPNPPQYDDVWTPEEIQESLRTGTLKVVGPGDPIDGQPTILLHREPGKADNPMDLWVDARTYLPVRWQWIQDNSTPFDVTYLPPTPDNVADLTTVVPDGFTKVN